MILCFVYGQDIDTLKSKKGAIILPQKGDFSFSIDAVPFLNLLNPKGESPGFNYLDSIPYIYLKYMLSDKSAIMFSPILTYMHTDLDGTPPDISDKLDGRFGQEYGFRIGYERRSGIHRLQIPYGIEGGFSYFEVYIWDKFTSSHTTSIGVKYFASILVGAEYFFLPKMSLGGRFSYSFYGLHSENSGEDYGYTERTNYLNYTNLGGALFLSFYF